MILTLLQRRNACLLCKHSRPSVEALRHDGPMSTLRFRRYYPAYSPTGHCPRFGKTINNDNRIFATCNLHERGCSIHAIFLAASRINAGVTRSPSPNHKEMTLGSSNRGNAIPVIPFCSRRGMSGRTARINQAGLIATWLLSVYSRYLSRSSTYRYFAFLKSRYAG